MIGIDGSSGLSVVKVQHDWWPRFPRRCGENMEHFAGWRHSTLTAVIQTEIENWAYQALLCIRQCQYIVVIVKRCMKTIDVTWPWSFFALRHVSCRSFLLTYLLKLQLIIQNFDRYGLLLTTAGFMHQKFSIYVHAISRFLRFLPSQRFSLHIEYYKQDHLQYYVMQNYKVSILTISFNLEH